MDGDLKLFYLNLSIKVFILLGGIWLALHFHPEFRLDSGNILQVFGQGLFPNVDTETALISLFFGIFAIIGFIEGKYAWSKSDDNIYGTGKVGNLGAIIGFGLMIVGFIVIVEELFIADDYVQLNEFKSWYFIIATILFFWLGKEEFIYSRSTIRAIKEKTNFG